MVADMHYKTNKNRARGDGDFKYGLKLLLGFSSKLLSRAMYKIVPKLWSGGAVISKKGPKRGFELSLRSL